MTSKEHEFWVECVVQYLRLGIALDPARAMADDDLDLWRECGDEADFSQLVGEPEEEVP